MNLSSGKEVEIYEGQGQIKVTDWNDMSTIFFTRDELVSMLAAFDKSEDLKPSYGLTKQQAIVISGYTQILMCNFGDFYEDVEKRLGRPVFTSKYRILRKK